jgi:hypothetical protein
VKFPQPEERKMKKTTFKIATNFVGGNRFYPDFPTIKYQEVEGYAIGNWGITDHWDKGKWTIYHTQKGLKLFHFPLSFDNALTALKKAVEIFGENNDGEPTPENYRLLEKWKEETFNLLPDSDDRSY